MFTALLSRALGLLRDRECQVGKRDNLGIVTLASSALYSGMPSGKSDSLGMLRSVPCGQAIPGMLQAKLGPPILPTCLVLTEKGTHDLYT